MQINQVAWIWLLYNLQFIGNSWLSPKMYTNVLTTTCVVLVLLTCTNTYLQTMLYKCPRKCPILKYKLRDSVSHKIIIFSAIFQ